MQKRCSQKEATAAFRKLALEPHPDKGGSEEAFHKPLAAYELVERRAKDAAISRRKRGEPKPKKKDCRKHERKTAEEAQSKRELEAATKIQATHRGNFARKVELVDKKVPKHTFQVVQTERAADGRK